MSGRMSGRAQNFAISVFKASCFRSWLPAVLCRLHICKQSGMAADVTCAVGAAEWPVLLRVVIMTRWLRPTPQNERLISSAWPAGSRKARINTVSPVRSAQAPAHKCRQRFRFLISKSKSQEREIERER